MAGLETPLFILILLLCLYVFNEGLFNLMRGSLMGALLMLLITIRPEGLLFAGGFVFLLTLEVYRGNSKYMKFPVYISTVLAMVSIVLLYSWRWETFGAIVPNTYYAKYATLFPSLKRGVGEVLRWLSSPGNLAITVGSIIWIITSLRSNGGFRSPSTTASRTHSLSLLVLIAISMVVVIRGSRYDLHYRYLLPMVPLILIAFQSWLGSENSRWSRGGWHRKMLPVFILFSLMTVVANFWEYQKFIEKEGWYWQHGYDTRLEVGHWLRMRNTSLEKGEPPPGSLWAYSEMGALPYSAGRTISFLDTYGLVDRQVASIIAKEWPFHSDTVAKYILSLEPEYILITSGQIVTPENCLASRLYVHPFVLNDTFLQKYRYFSTIIQSPRRVHVASSAVFRRSDVSYDLEFFRAIRQINQELMTRAEFRDLDDKDINKVLTF